ncbi:MAG: hypothetical protein NT040_17170 [Bacteroidetes bacterium]|nr:hypothetical protein [Bacteroidota bacterium]
MKKFYLLAAILILTVARTTAQVGINADNSAPDNSAILDVKSTSKGFLPPRVALTAANVASPVTAPATGLFVYNTSISGTAPNNVIPGYYYWNGTRWMAALVPQGTTAGDMLFWNGTQWAKLPIGLEGEVLTLSNGIPSWGGKRLPIVSTTQISGVSSISAISGGYITTDGGIPVTARGVCWSTAPDPVVSGSHTLDGSGTGTFTSSLTGLAAGTLYYVRAYASSSTGITYGSAISFTTVLCGASITINHYISGGVAPVDKTVTYSLVTGIPGAPSKCWIASNLGADHQATAMSDPTEPSAGWYWQFNRKQGYKHDGTNLTPGNTWVYSIVENSDWLPGNDPCTLELGVYWRIPTNAEWYNVDANWYYSYGPDPWNSALKLHSAGAIYSGSLYDRGSWGYQLSSTQAALNKAVTRLFCPVVYYNSNLFKTDACSIRCLCDAGTAGLIPTVTTSPVINITSSTSTSGGSATVDGNATVTARGVCWSTSFNPTTADNHTTDGGGTGTFTSNITGLTANNLYHVRAYATSVSGTGYGEEVTFTTLSAILPSVSSTGVSYITTTNAIISGNVSFDGYATVTARGVCWSTSPNPTFAGSHTTDGSGTGIFTSNLTGLTVNTRYYARAYATNNAGTGYGDYLTFNTLLSPLLPTVTTAAATSIALFSATSGGTVISDGGESVTLRGVCWSTSSNPTTSNSHTTDGSGTGTFTSSITGLTASTIYHIRAYATNTIGTVYGEDITFTSLSPSIPTVTTSEVYNITVSVATSGGNVTSDGGATITARGVCWSASPGPLATGNHSSEAGTTGSFVSSLTGLAPQTLYYVRAYATNSVGTAYGDEVSFSTISCGAFISVNHLVSGGVAPVNKLVTYGTVGNIPGEPDKCWITSNLGADHQPTAVNDGTEPSAGWYWQFNRKQGYKHDGTIQTPYVTWNISIDESGDWLASNDPCTLELGAGWRIPTYEEWTYVSYPDGGNWTDWNGPWNSGLKLHAAGYIPSNGSLSNRNSQGYYWSSEHGLFNYNGRNLFFDSGNCFFMEFMDKTNGFPLRCLIDDGSSSQIPSVTTSPVTNATQTAASTGGNVTFAGGAMVTARGVCWSTSSNPTTADNHTTDGSGTGVFTSNPVGLSPGLNYYIRAYATNSAGTAYGNKVIYTPFACGSSITINHLVSGGVAPVDKLVTYGTVNNIPGEIAKCWITGNLGADHQAIAVNDATEASAGWYWQFNRKQGYKHDGTIRTPNTAWITYINEDFDWQAANDPCTLELGAGWRIPTYAEWNNVNAVGNWSNWNGPWNSGLKLHGAGFLYNTNGSLGGRSSQGHYWSSNNGSSDLAWVFVFTGGFTQIPVEDKANGLSLRCLIDNGSAMQIPSVTTSPATNITLTSATSGGNVTSDGGATVTARGVCWSTSSNPTTANSHTTDGSGTGTFTSSLTGLTAYTLYHARAYAVNSIGTAYGSEITFATNVIPTVTTAAVTGITQTTAVSGGNVTSDGGAAVTARGVCWSTSSNPTTANSKTTDGSGTGTFTSTLTGLTFNTFYHVRAYAVNSVGTAYGTEVTFTTLPGNPAVTTLAVSGITQTTAVCEGNVSSDNGATVTTRGVCWSTSANPTTANSHTTDGSGTGSFTSNLTGLTANTLYHVRAYATNSAGTGYGSDMTFTTLPLPVLPTVTTAPVTNIMQTSALSGGNVTSDGWATVTARGVCWSTSPGPTTSNSHTTNGGGTGTFTSSLSGLTRGTLYYIRAYATNSIGTAYGAELNFTTLPCGDPLPVNHVVSGGVAPVAKSVTYGTVTNVPGETAKCWITSNLGADHQATAVTDATEPSAGWYWQFNRKKGYKNDGTVTPAWSISSISESFDWLSYNDPCMIELGTGWHVPTSSEWTNVDAGGSWTNGNGPWNSLLKMHYAGYLDKGNGAVGNRGISGDYWSANQSALTTANDMDFGSSNSGVVVRDKAYGFPVRCVRNN